ncbi:MAG: undecaprenyl-diphosphate phosphatase [Brevundimonas sp.]|jgi:undecaprenyl-diphosphatase|uniref:undecaprenyl-diphosphate phosphatase n=1 Tax=Brevundimonas sp. TaxID=1871086 RepID=UPI00391AFD54
MSDWLIALLLGLLEGLTEFIPVSSTGHILLAGHFMGFESTGRAFEVLIQLGAILALLSVYARKLFEVGTRWPHDPEARNFIFGIAIAFVPAAVLGVLLHPIIKGVFFESPTLICVMLVLGGFALLGLDRMKREPRYSDASRFSLRTCLIIGLFQCLALIPGVSRSGATIAGGLLVGADKRSAAEFSFFLAMPTMAGAFVYDLYKNWGILDLNDAGIIIVGFIAAFFTAVLVVKFLLGFVARHGFTPFALWRIAVGSIGLIALYFTGDLGGMGSL